METPMDDVIKRLRNVPGLRIEDGTSSWTARLPKPPAYDFELVVPHDQLEWFVTARDHTTGAKVWSDWKDYPRAWENRDQRRTDMSNDIEWFVATLTRATALRFSTERMVLVLRRRVAEWQVDGQWRLVSLTPLAGARRGD
jgi:hypothetical protein